MAWALATAAAQGSRLNARLLLMLSSQLSALMVLQPAVLSLYPEQIRSLLLVGGQPQEGECQCVGPFPSLPIADFFFPNNMPPPASSLIEIVFFYVFFSVFFLHFF